MHSSTLADVRAVEATEPPKAPAPTSRRAIPRSARRLALWFALALLLLPLVPIAGALGFLGPRTYLVVSQDPAELRPYGGYVGAYAAVVLLFGRVDSIDYGDSKHLDTPNSWPLDAASDSPDFPTAAAAMATVYGGATDQWPYAVIAIDPIAVSGLLEQVGPVRVPSESRPITPDNLFGIVLEHTQDFDDPSVDRKQIVYELGWELARRVRALPPTHWPRVAQALGRAAEERHIQVFFTDPVLRALIKAKGWDGAYPPPTDDFLAVVDENAGYNKANLVTDQTLDYHVTLATDGARTATLRINYANRGTRQLSFEAGKMPYLNEAPYLGTVSVYVPAGTRYVGTGEPAELAPDVGRGVFVQNILVPPERRAGLILTYRLPDRAIAGRRMEYALLVRKQAGTNGTPIHVRVSGPPGWHVVGGADQEWAAQALLTTDQRFGVVFEPPTSG